MKKNFRKMMVCAIFAIFISISIIPISSSLSIKSNSSEKPSSPVCAPPVIVDAYWELEKSPEGWTVTFTMVCYDETSGMDRVEFAIDDDLMYTDDTPPSPYIWVLENPFEIEDWKEKTIYVTAFDKAGNSDFVEFSCSEIKSRSYNRVLDQILSNMWFYQLFIRLLKI